TLVMSVGFQANISRLRLSNSSYWPSSVKVEPIDMVCSRYSGWIAT
nr:hypothetical protein [Tanacetum cinerariifolium]